VESERQSNSKLISQKAPKTPTKPISQQPPEMLVRMRRSNGVLTVAVNVSRYFQWRKRHISGVQGTAFAPAIGPFVSTVAIPLSDLGVAQLQDIESVVLELKAGEKIAVGLGNVSLRRK
jgi:hypothetical protein